MVYQKRNKTIYWKRSKTMHTTNMCSVTNLYHICNLYVSLVAQMVKNLPTMQENSFDPWVGKIPWRREWLPTPVFLPGKFHGQRSLASYSPWESRRVGHNWVTFITLLHLPVYIDTNIKWTFTICKEMYKNGAYPQRVYNVLKVKYVVTTLMH